MPKDMLWDLLISEKLPLKCPICHENLIVLSDNVKEVKFKCRNEHKWSLEIEQ